MSVPTEVPVDDEGEVAPEPASEDGRGGHLVAVVTGASRGIGRFVADALEDAGYAVERGSSAVAPVTDRAALTAWVDEIVERFCVLGTADEHIAKLTALAEIGVTQFAGYLQHDNKEETLRVYGETIIPAMREHVAAKA